jgi:hypothetical protein
MFNGEPLQLKVKGIKLRTDGERRLCDVRLEAEITDDIAGGLPDGHARYKALEAGSEKRTVLDTSAAIFEMVMSTAAKDDVFKSRVVQVLEVPLARKDSEEGGAAGVVARPLVSLPVSDGLVLYLAHHFADADLTFRLTNLQPSLPLTSGGNGKSEAKPERQLELDEKPATAKAGKKPGKPGKRVRA